MRSFPSGFIYIAQFCVFILLYHYLSYMIYFLLEFRSVLRYVWINVYFGLDLTTVSVVNPSNAELNRICHLMELLGAHHILHVSRIRVKLLCRCR